MKINNPYDNHPQRKLEQRLRDATEYRLRNEVNRRNLNESK